MNKSIKVQNVAKNSDGKLVLKNVPIEEKIVSKKSKKDNKPKKSKKDGKGSGKQRFLDQTERLVDLKMGLKLAYLQMIKICLFATIFLGLFVYFYYDLDSTKLLGFLGYAMFLMIFMQLCWIPFLGVAAPIWYWYDLNDVMLSFWRIDSSALTTVVMNFYMIVGLIIAILVILYFIRFIMEHMMEIVHEEKKEKTK